MGVLAGIGNAVLDVINYVAVYPDEDHEVRATGQRVQRGGNVANLLTVARQFGIDCRWIGTLGDDAHAQVLRQAMEGDGIDTLWAESITGGITPTSYVTVSAATASRTIVHYRQLPELSLSHLLTCDLSKVDWLHLEARNALEQSKMLEYVRTRWPQLPISLEIEKPRTQLAELLPFCDVVFVSHHYAREKGHQNLDALVTHLNLSASQILIHTQGAQGVSALISGEPYYVPAVSPPKVVETLAAGDTFIGATIAYRMLGKTWLEALIGAAEVAGRKCGQLGLGGLVSANNQDHVATR